MNAAAVRAYTTGVLRARAAYRERTKCVTCGDFKPVRADSIASFCAACLRKRRLPKTTKRRRRAA